MRRGWGTRGGRTGGGSRSRIQHHKAGFLGGHDEIVVSLSCLVVVVKPSKGVQAGHAARQVVASRRTKRRSHRREGRAVVMVVEVGASRVAESLGKGVGLDLELGNTLVLVGGDGGELGFREDKGPVLLLFYVADGTVVTLTTFDQIHTGLELVHGVEDELTRVV